MFRRVRTYRRTGGIDFASHALYVCTQHLWKDRFEKLNKDYEELKQKAQPFLDAIEIASEKVWAFINAILARGKELYEHKHPARNRGQDMEI